MSSISTRESDVRAECDGPQKARWVKGFPASAMFTPTKYTVGAERGEFYAYDNEQGFFFKSTTPQAVFTSLRNEMNNRGITGGIIHLKALTFTNVNVVLDRDNTTLEGEGWQSFIDGGTGIAVTITGDGCVIRNIGCRSTGTDAIYVNGGDARVQNVWVWGAGRDGILISSSDVDVNNCLIASVTRHGVFADGDSSASRIKDCYIWLTGYDGVLISGMNIDVGGNYIAYIGRYGVHVDYDDAKIYDNEIMNCLSGGVFVTSRGDWVLITDNDIWATGSDGVHISSGADYGNIADNLLYSWTVEPIDNNDATNTVKDNNCGGSVCNSKGCCFETISGALYHMAQGTPWGYGGWVEVPVGTWNEAVVVRVSGLELRGQGWETIINGGAIGSAITVSGIHITVRDLTVRTTPATGNPYDGIESNGGDFLKIEHVRVNGSDNEGFNLANTNLNQCIVKDCYIYAPDGDGIDSAMYNSRIVDNSLYYCGDMGVYLRSGENVVRGNQIYNTDDQGIAIHSRENRVTENHLNAIDHYGIDCADSRNIVKGNYIENQQNNSGAAIYVRDVSGAIISDNFIRLPATSSGYGIRVIDGSSGVVINCNVVDTRTGLSGIWLSGFNHCVTGNVCTTKIQNNSTGSTVANNETP